MKDLTLTQELRVLGDRYLSIAEDKAFFARKMADMWVQIAEIEERAAERRKRPSGMMRAVGRPEDER